MGTEEKRNTITQADIDHLIEHSVQHDRQMGRKTTVLTLGLPNGFEITESSSCVDPLNYEHGLGVELCLEKIKKRLAPS